MRRNPIYRSLNEVPMWGGVQKDFVLSNVAFTAVTIAGLGWWWTLIPSFAFHSLMRIINRNDPLVLTVYRRYAKQATRYEPWPHITQASGKRPDGFSRGLLC
ncbi:MAG: VirB3 family type IV secretion system protein [Casimicrobium sp.]|jgi:type IV secretion system protein VirB3